MIVPFQLFLVFPPFSALFATVKRICPQTGTDNRIGFSQSYIIFYNTELAVNPNLRYFLIIKMPEIYFVKLLQQH